MEMTALQGKLARRTLPRLWLMTDERIADDALLAAVERMPAGAGIVFRHYGLPPKARRALFEQVRMRARRGRLVLLLAGPPAQAVAWKADGWHGRKCGPRVRQMLHTASAHSASELRAAERAGADGMFLSPVYSTRSHPRATALGHVRFGLLALRSPRPVIALGGMTPKRADALPVNGIHGWAAIDYWVK